MNPFRLITRTIPLLSAAALLAQGVQVPAVVTSSLPHLMPANSRLQVVVDSSALASGPRQLDRLALLFQPSSLGAASFPVEVSLAATATDTAAMSPSFARNAPNGTTNVYSGVLNVPAGTGNQPVFAELTLATPFTVDPAAGDLVVEVAFPTGAPRFLVLARKENAQTTPFGPMSDRFFPGYGIAPNDLQTNVSLEPGTGRLLVANYVEMVAGQLVLVAFGTSNTQYGSLSLPASLASFGAPGQWLLVAPQGVAVSTGVYVVSCGFPMRWDGVQFALPLSGQLAGAVFHAQAFVLGGQASVNAANVSTSDAVTVHLGDMTPAPAQAIFGSMNDDLGRFEPTAPYSLRASAFQSPVLRFVFKP